MQTDEQFLVLDDSRAQYCKTATEAVLAAGFNKWDCALPALAVSRLMPGDEMSMNAYYSIIRLSGKDIDYVDLR